MMHKRRLKNLNDLRKWLADAGNRLEAGTIDQSHARCIAYMASIMSSVIKDSDLEARITALETTITEERRN